MDRMKGLLTFYSLLLNFASFTQPTWDVNPPLVSDSQLQMDRHPIHLNTDLNKRVNRKSSVLESTLRRGLSTKINQLLFSFQ